MDKELQVGLTKCRNGLPLALIRNLPGADAELRPEQMRVLAAALSMAADECEAWSRENVPKGMQLSKRSYPLTAPGRTPFFSADLLEATVEERQRRREERLRRQMRDMDGK